jgi:hypothetical protein
MSVTGGSESNHSLRPETTDPAWSGSNARQCTQDFLLASREVFMDGSTSTDGSRGEDLRRQGAMHPVQEETRLSDRALAHGTAHRSSLSSVTSGGGRQHTSGSFRRTTRRTPAVSTDRWCLFCPASFRYVEPGRLVRGRSEPRRNHRQSRFPTSLSGMSLPRFTDRVSCSVQMFPGRPRESIGPLAQLASALV